MFKSLIVALALVLGAALPAHATLVDFTAKIEQDQVVPPSGSPAFGAGVLQLDDVTHLLDIAIVNTSILLTAPELSAQIHGPAPVGANGPPIADLPLGSLKLANLDLSLLAACSGDVVACETDLKAGLWYVLITSTAGAEVRGQILPVLGVAEPSVMYLMGLGLVGLWAMGRGREERDALDADGARPGSGPRRLG
jgi:hypothetical protein